MSNKNLVIVVETTIDLENILPVDENTHGAYENDADADTRNHLRTGSICARFSEIILCPGRVSITNYEGGDEYQVKLPFAKYSLIYSVDDEGLFVNGAPGRAEIIPRSVRETGSKRPTTIIDYSMLLKRPTARVPENERGVKMRDFGVINGGLHVVVICATL